MQLDTPLEKITRIDATQKQALKRLGLLTVRDLLYYFPTRYSHISNVKQIRDLAAGETATVYGTITSIETKKSFKTKIPMSEATIEDLSGSIKILWFHQAYMAKMIHEGQMVSLTGKVSSGTRGLYFSNPEVETGAVMPIDSHDSLFGDGSEAEAVFGYPVYAESRGVTSRWMYHTIKKIFQSGLVSSFEEYIPEPILKKYKLPSIATALVWIHTPKNENDAEAARKRFAFEEVFFIQLKRQQERGSYEENRSYDVHVYDEDLQDFISRFPFTPTKAQQDAISAIQTDMAKKHPMARLLEGDVGSGKTAVAASAAYAVIRNRPKGQDFGALQVAYMAPTEILAVQHFENFIKYFTHTGIQIGLITGSGCRKFPSKVASSANSWTNISRNQLLKWVANGEVPIVIGTHALIQKNVKFNDDHGSVEQVSKILLEHTEKENHSSYCHNDFGASNIFATQPLTIFDPNPRFNNGYLDLGQCLMKEIAHGDDYREAVSQLIDGYFSGGAYNEKVLHASIFLNAVIKLPYKHKTGKTEVIDGIGAYLKNNSHWFAA
jgi:ATP-dependent DNA helicase RecG